MQLKYNYALFVRSYAMANNYEKVPDSKIHEIKIRGQTDCQLYVNTNNLHVNLPTIYPSVKIDCI